MTHNLHPYQPPRQQSEAEIILQIRHDLQKFHTGKGIYQNEHVQMLLDKIQAQTDTIYQLKKEIRHVEKFINRMQMWKNKFWLSVIKTENSGYYRKHGLQGKRVFGWSVRLRVLGREVI